MPLFINDGEDPLSALSPTTHASVDHSAVAQTFINIGTTTDASGSGDFASGLTGAGRWFYDQGTNTLNLYESAGGTLQTTLAFNTVLTTTSQDIVGAINELDTAIAGQNELSEILTNGNITGGSNILITSGDIIDSATAVPLVIGSTTATGVTIGNITSSSTATLKSGTGAMTFTAGGIFDVNATGAVTVDGSTITLTSAAVLSLDGTGIETSATTLTSDAGLSVLTTTTGVLSLDSGTTGAVNLGTGASAKTVTVGSITGAAITTIQAGSGAMTFTAGGIFDVNATGAVTVDGSTVTLTSAAALSLDSTSLAIINAAGTIYGQTTAAGAISLGSTPGATDGTLALANITQGGYTDMAAVADPGVPGASVARLWCETDSLALATANGTAYLQTTAAGAMDLGTTPGAQDGMLVTGTVSVGDGTVGAPALAFTSDADASGTGIFRAAANTIGFAINGSYEIGMASTGMILAVPLLGDTNGTPTDPSIVVDSADTTTGLYGNGAGSLYVTTGGVVRATFGSTSTSLTGALTTPHVLAGVLVEANTAGSGAPNVLTSAENNTYLTNEGATAENYHTLPTAVAGARVTLICQDTDGIRATANTGDTIRLDGAVSAAAGYVSSTSIGSTVTLVAINATEWVAVSIVGTWSVN